MKRGFFKEEKIDEAIIVAKDQQLFLDDIEGMSVLGSVIQMANLIKVLNI